MSIRRTLQIAAVTLALGGAIAPQFTVSEAQVNDPNRTTTTDDRGDTGDYGWIGIFGLAGLAGLLGNRRETTVSRTIPGTQAAR
jgi:hypothetical protein